MVDQILDKLESQKLLNDEDLACRRAWRQRKEQLWGNHKIAGNLKRLAIDAKIIKKVLVELETQKGQTETLQCVIQHWVAKHGAPTATSAIKKLFDHCFRLGYESELIREALSPYFGNVMHY